MSTPYQTPEASLNISGLVPCEGCGKEIHSSAATCPQCGFSRRSSRYKSKTTAALFAFFLGGFGAHRFYLGQWWGIFYLLLFWLYIPGLIALIEFVYFLVCDTEKWDNKYNDGMPAGPNEKGGGAAVVIVLVVGIFFFVAVVGILAAVALPAYQDYTNRARVNEVLIEVAPIKARVADYYLENQNLPIHNSQLQLEDPHTLSDGNTLRLTPNGLVIVFRDPSLTLNPGAPTMVLTPIQQSLTSITWECYGGTLQNKLRPSMCRN